MAKRPESPDIFKGYISFDGEIRYCDAIEFMGELWLVTDWSESHTAGWSKPTRIVALASLGPVLRAGRTWTLDGPAPKSLLSNPIPPELRARFRVVDRPPLEFLYLPGLN